MTKSTGPTHVVVDGSNIATEGRSMPSLAQLNDAVLAFAAEHPDARITVVVDATFGHRIPKSEAEEFDAAVANNELVAPPAGAVGRGDAFVLGIAKKANATILSNDSFQEFHGDNPWLFDDGRLIGGKPVPHVGWVFVPRLPVRGAVSRKAVRESKKPTRGEPAAASTGRRSRSGGVAAAKKASAEASLPMPVPTTPPPGRAVAADAVNELMPFLDFVERHPVGTSVNAIVDSYSSHGAYVRIGDVRGYVPLRMMGDPPPRSARDIMKINDAVTLVVSSFAPARRSIDLAVPHAGLQVEPAPTEQVIADAVGEGAVPPSRRRRRGAAAETVEAPTDARPAAEPAATPSRRRTKKAAAAVEPVEPVQPVQPVTADEAPAAAAKPSRRRSAKTAAPDVTAPPAPDPAPAEAPPARPARARRAAKAAPAKAAPAKAAARASDASTAEPAPATRRRSTKRAPADAAPPSDTAPAGDAPAAAPARSRRAKKAAS